MVCDQQHHLQATAENYMHCILLRLQPKQYLQESINLIKHHWPDPQRYQIMNINSTEIWIHWSSFKNVCKDDVSEKLAEHYKEENLLSFSLKLDFKSYFYIWRLVLDFLYCKTEVKLWPILLRSFLHVRAEYFLHLFNHSKKQTLL